MNTRHRFLVFGCFLLLFPVLSFGQSIQLADSLFQTAKNFEDGGNIEQSEFYYREAYNLYRDFEDTASWLEAGKEYASAMMYRAKNEQAMELYKKLLEVDHPANDAYNRGDLYNSMGLLSKRTGKLEQAEKYYQQSLPLAEESGDSLLIGVVHSNLGGIHRARGNYTRALEQQQKSLPYFEGLDRKRNISTTLGNIGGIYRELSVHDKALEYYNKSIEIRKELGDIRLLASTYNGIGRMQRELGNYDQALVSYQKALELSRQAGTLSRTSSILNNLGLLYKSLGEYDKALDYYRQSLAISEEISGRGTIATTTKNIGKLLWDQERFEEAEPYYRKALELRRQVGNPREIASSLNTMVDLALKDDNYKEAQNYANEIQALGDSTGNYRIREYAANYMGKIKSQQGEHDEAVKHYKKKYAFSEYLTPGKKLGALVDLAREYDKLNSDSAIVYGEKAINIIEQQRASAGATSELRSGFFDRFSDFYVNNASWILKYDSDISRAYRLVEKAKARSLSDELAKASQNIEQKMPEQVRLERNEKRDHINSLYSELELTVDEQERARIQEKIRDAETDYAAFENRVHNENPDLKSLKSPESITLNRARNLVDHNTAALEYAVAGNQLIMFFISQNDVRVEQYSLTNDQEIAEELTNWVADFKDAILSNASRATLRSESTQLYNVLLRPFEEELNSFENLIIVPDGALAYLPFEAISQGDQYLIENFNIKYEPSLTSLTLLQNPESITRKDLLAVAGSQFSGENSRTMRSVSLSSLPSTTIEVDSIAAHFRDISILKENEVTEASLKNLLRQNQYRYVHMATHGIIDEEQPSRSGLALSTEGELTASSEEDGMLRTSEIFGLDVNSDMVVLSACNTGLGKVVNGEGILGMQRSFFYAGASTVVVSLWNIYDRSTASFMDKFYKALLETETQESWTSSMLRWVGWDKSIPFGRKAVAMRDAKLQMIKHPLFNHPIYWAPFIVVGR